MLLNGSIEKEGLLKLRKELNILYFGLMNLLNILGQTIILKAIQM
jgi:uncharacterized protein YhhL (DUF1145 family)